LKLELFVLLLMHHEDAAHKAALYVQLNYSELVLRIDALHLCAESAEMQRGKMVIRIVQRRASTLRRVVVDISAGK
jgi:hypothetical protein